MANYSEIDAAKAAQEPCFDYFSAQPPLQPKFEIGQYVRECGFSVPLIDSQEEWTKVFDGGTALLRSELPQDYKGLSGLLRSKQVLPFDEQADETDLLPEYRSDVLQGLRDGLIDPTEYMQGLQYIGWREQQAKIRDRIRYFGGKIIDFSQASASRWRYIEGTNVTVFADPHVEGRYHFGVRPAPTPERQYQSIGDYTFDKGQYDEPQQFRKHYTPFTAGDLVEYYEAIQRLPFFDNTVHPVLELQKDQDGQIHFLQYLKTPQRRNYIDPFELPTSPDTVRLTNVRGITPEEGMPLRLFVEPSYLTPEMESQAIFCGLIKPHGLEVQIASQAAGFILHEAYISFKDNHFDTSPMYRPPLAAGLAGCQDSPDTALEGLKRLLDFVDGPQHHGDRIPYLDIHVTSNGHEAAVESDWEIKIA